MKKYRLIFAIIILLLFSFILCSCASNQSMVLLLDADGGSGDGTTAVISKDTQLPSPEKPGYKFNGWYIDENRSTPYTYEIFSENSKFGDQKIVYADFEPISFNITYNLNGGLNGANAASYTINDEIILNNATRTGYTFGGWYDNEVFSGAAVTHIALNSVGDKILYAKWLPYDITYFLNGGVNNPLNSPSYDGSQQVTLYAPTKTGYTFDGWYTSASFSGGRVEFLMAGSTRDREFFAKWNIDSFTVSYDLKGGENSSDNVFSYNISQGVTLFDAFRMGYSFDGWYLKPSGDRLTAIAQGTVGNIELEARWTAVEYGITYVLYDGQNHEDNPAGYTVTDAFTLLPAAKTGYNFLGWADGSNNTVTSVSVGSTGLKVFYARWEAQIYSIYYPLDGGTQNPANPSVYNVTSNI
ncbi:MAG: InlB B-repeat-containing protein, partial [Clostridia bacterium]|nr:InlB B-repeat-containing protein [Clostridia bacterium]